MRNKFYQIVSLILLSVLTNCISVRDYKVPEVDNASLKIEAPAKKTKVFVDWKFKSTMPFNNSHVLKTASILHKNALNETFRKSGCCLIVDDEKLADVKISGSFRNESSGTGLVFAMVTGFSMYLIPSWINAKIRISAKVEKGKNAHDYDLKDSMLFAQWMPFILVMPFRGNAIKSEEEMNENLYRNLFLKLKNDGIL